LVGPVIVTDIAPFIV